MSIDTSSEARAVWRFEDKEVLASTTSPANLPDLWLASHIDHAELYGIMRSTDVKEVLLTVTEPIFVGLVYREGIDVFKLAWSEHRLLMSTYINAFDPVERGVNWAKEGF